MPIEFPVIVLSRTGTGLATIRCLAAMDIEVHAAIFLRQEPVNYTRLATKYLLDRQINNDIDLIEWLIAHAQKLDARPMILPTGDHEALLLAQYHDKLHPHCRLWRNKYDDLLGIIDKHRLYRIAENAGVSIVPSIDQPNLMQLIKWVDSHSAPYLVKPSYETALNNKIGGKNISFHDSAALLTWAQQNDLTNVIVQRRLRGGDGNIFDCYGLCNAAGNIVTLATHRRWRQHLPDVGATSMGEIPANYPKIESEIIEQTQRLLNTIDYHGIFGIEWLHDIATGKLHLIDFNARPFSTISHLADCGLNLPYLAVRELAGADLSDVALLPTLKHKFWVDFSRDFETFTIKNANGKITLFEWLRSLVRCRSFAYWNWKDPGPWLHQAFALLQRISKRGWRAAIALVQFIPLDF